MHMAKESPIESPFPSRSNDGSNAYFARKRAAWAITELKANDPNVVFSRSVSEVYPGPTRFGGSNGDALFPCVSCSLRETASATVEMGRRQCRLAGSGFPAGFALTGIERDRASPRCAAAFLITETLLLNTLPI